MKLLEVVDDLLNRITMYRLVAYVLGILSAAGIGAALLGHLASSPTSMVVSLGLLLASTWAAERGFGRLFGMATNSESWLITALILFLILHPASTLAGGVALVLAGALSSASKFLLSYNGKHLFNPAAFAAAVTGITGLAATTWWIGSSLFWPLTFVLGLAVVRKIRRFPLFLAFAITTTSLLIMQILIDNQPVWTNLQHALLASPFLFLGTIMLTEPATMPPRRNQQILFGALVAALYVTGWHIGPLVIYPEVALLIGNVYAFAVAPKFKLRLRLNKIQPISERVYNYVFIPDRPFRFLPGQYMEWTLAGVPYDSRGNRRTFTIASSPTEREVHLGLKYYEPASSFKTVFAGLQPGATVYASQLAGNFTLPEPANKKLAFIAGGIGITPFRSMVKYLTDMNLRCDAVLLYVVSDPQEFAYLPVLNAGAGVGVRTVPIVTQAKYAQPGAVTGKLSADMIARLIPDFAERQFYVSGSSSMVDATKAHLHRMGVRTGDIKTDHFSGY